MVIFKISNTYVTFYFQNSYLNNQGIQCTQRIRVIKNMLDFQ